jgi:hypothetical protein
MNDIEKLLYQLLEQNGHNTEQRLVDKRVDDQTLELTLDYTDQAITNYVVLAQDNTILIRYEDDENNLHQDAIQTDNSLQTNTLRHEHNDGYLTISIKHNGGSNGKRTHRR